MRSNILSVCVVAAMTLGGAAFAGTTTTKPVVAAAATTTAAASSDTSGMITKISTKGNYVVLSDGWKYHLPSGFALKSFKVGEKVSVTYVLKGKHHDVTAMTAA